ncbi:hypothetical protein PoB_005221100 [Plakobranchus ocellatus]|uniref:Transmembrane protein n=1 Tax=Plakobranchus ocellatus TaxID=259542 RepID=A0AAV4BR22_9GAST|nr:hypothetical protein PoB_005221100 [Plakobranchus ocellatus]
MKKREGRYNLLPRLCLFVITRPVVFSSVSSLQTLRHFLRRFLSTSSPPPVCFIRRLAHASFAVSPARPPPSPVRVLCRLPCASSAVSPASPPPSPVRVLRGLPCVSSLYPSCVICRLPCASSAVSRACLRYLPCA